MRRAALLALACLAGAGEPDVRLPAASEARKPAEGAAIIRLTADGLVVVDRDGKLEPLSLDQVSRWLRDRKGVEVTLRADEKAPWLHVQRVIEICADARAGFGVKGAGGEEGRLELPAGSADARAAKVVVRIVVTKEEPAVWGPTQAAVTLPAEITYRMADIEAKEIEAVRRYIRDAAQTAASSDDTVTGEIRAQPKVPFGVVVAVLNEYHRAGLKDVRFEPPAPASPEERRASRLSYPK